LDSGTLNYLAGFFEGRGTITFDLYKEERTRFKVHIRPRIQMIISQDDRVILDLFETALPVKWEKKVRKNGSICLRIRTLDDIRTFLNILSPFFRLPTTQEKAKLMMEFLKIKYNYRRITRNIFKRMLLIVRRMKELQRNKNRREFDVDILIKRLTSAKGRGH